MSFLPWIALLWSLITKAFPSVTLLSGWFPVSLLYILCKRFPVAHEQSRRFAFSQILSCRTSPRHTAVTCQAEWMLTLQCFSADLTRHSVYCGWNDGCFKKNNDKKTGCSYYVTASEAHIGHSWSHLRKLFPQKQISGKNSFPFRLIKQKKKKQSRLWKPDSTKNKVYVYLNKAFVQMKETRFALIHVGMCALGDCLMLKLYCNCRRAMFPCHVCADELQISSGDCGFPCHF